MAALDPVGNYNQIKGNHMVAQLQEYAIEHMAIQGGGESLYFILDDRKELVGMNHIQCNDMELKMAENALQWIEFQSKPIGTFYPADQLKQEQMQLKGFVWYQDRCPTENIANDYTTKLS